MSNYERNSSFHSLFTFQNIWNPPDHFRVRAGQNKNQNGAQYFQATYQHHPVYQKALSGLQANGFAELWKYSTFLGQYIPFISTKNIEIDETWQPYDHISPKSLSPPREKQVTPFVSGPPKSQNFVGPSFWKILKISSLPPQQKGGGHYGSWYVIWKYEKRKYATRKYVLSNTKNDEKLNLSVRKFWNSRLGSVFLVYP